MKINDLHPHHHLETYSIAKDIIHGYILLWGLIPSNTAQKTQYMGYTDDEDAELPGPEQNKENED